jgi:hypothetical protein
MLNTLCLPLSGASPNTFRRGERREWERDERGLKGSSNGLRGKGGDVCGSYHALYFSLKLRRWSGVYRMFTWYLPLRSPTDLTRVLFLSSQLEGALTRA